MNELLLISIIAFLALACWILFIYARIQLRQSIKVRMAINNQNNAHTILINRLRRCQIMADLDKLLEQMGVPREQGRVLTPRKKIIVPKGN